MHTDHALTHSDLAAPTPSPLVVLLLLLLSAGLSITPDMDEETRAKIRREKNRVAARKCRAKKMQFMVELQKTLRELMRKNEEYRLQVSVWGLGEPWQYRHGRTALAVQAWQYRLQVLCGY